MTVLPAKEMLNFLTSMMYFDDVVIAVTIVTFLSCSCFEYEACFGIFIL